MEHLIAFVLGIVIGLGLIGLGYIVKSVLTMKKDLKRLETLHEMKEDITEDDRRTLDQKLKNIEDWTLKLIEQDRKSIEDAYREINDKIKELNSYVDSRFDKQSDRFATVISSNLSMLRDDHEKLKELHKMQMDQFAKVTLDHSERLADLETSRKIQEDKIEQINS
jgi:hypothetical protein